MGKREVELESSNLRSIRSASHYDTRPALQGFAENPVQKAACYSFFPTSFKTQMIKDDKLVLINK